ncbi:hypothetical protein CRG98_006021 [Punica granatum]|uniref:Reverse transcriptase Ty1/copia-type domain-containing protein n=1 Tax=Punica granatum TaxID=22663 RepID=A0A2I0KYZ4_PUNGR|nr:hypothetical protein CRG98_006021 [Punica granatum]
MTKAPFTGKGERASDLMALIHTDVCGPVNKLARGGYLYFITFTDDFSRFGYVYLMKYKSESFEKFKEFKNEEENQLGYYFYNPTEGKVFVARTAVFLEKEFLFKGTSGRKLGLGEVLPQNDIDRSMGKVAEQPQGVVVQSYTQVTQEPRRSGRIRYEPERYGFLVTQENDVLLVDKDEPTTYAKAVTGPDSEKWLEAMRSEMESMYTNQVWTLVDPLEGVKPIGCKWVFKKKTDMNSNVINFKGRLVAKGFRQVHGVDYDETFSSVAMLKSIRILLAIAAYYDYEI